MKIKDNIPDRLDKAQRESSENLMSMEDVKRLSAIARRKLKRLRLPEELYPYLRFEAYFYVDNGRDWLGEVTQMQANFTQKGWLIKPTFDRIPARRTPYGGPVLRFVLNEEVFYDHGFARPGEPGWKSQQWLIKEILKKWKFTVNYTRELKVKDSDLTE